MRVRSPRKIKLFLSAFALLLTACGLEKPREDSRHFLIGASAISDSADAQGVVRLESEGKGYCVGVLVAADLVITAAHCIDPDIYPDLKIRFPLSGVSLAAAETKKVREDALVYFPNFDLGWIRLPENAPAPYQPVQILGESKNLPAKSKVSLIGFSTQNPCDMDDADCPLFKLESELVSTWSSSHLISLAVVKSPASNPQGRTCSGDSGGPGFVATPQGRALFALVAGKDPIFEPDNQNADPATCGSPSTTMTRIGDYQAWIEKTSGRKLNVITPASKPLSLEFLGVNVAVPTTAANWNDWFQKPNTNEAAWESIHKLLEQIALEYQGKIPAEEIPQIFQDPAKARVWLEKLTTLDSLTLGFPSRTLAVTDLRPFSVLKNLENLAFLSRDYKGLAFIQELKKLKSLSVTGRISSRQQGDMQWTDIRSASLSSLSLEQIGTSKLRGLSLAHFPALKSFQYLNPVGNLGTKWLATQDLQKVESLYLQELVCDNGSWPGTTMDALESLTLRTTNGLLESQLFCIQWSLLPSLQDIVIQGYRRENAGIEDTMLPEQVQILRRDP